MKILLDTHVFLWAITDDPRMKAAHREIYRNDESDLYLSAASVWEALIKAGLGKLPLPLPAAEYLERQMRANRVTLLGILPRHLRELEKLPLLHRDPFDRMIMAQAKAEGMALMTVDGALGNYGVEIV